MLLAEPGIFKIEGGVQVRTFAELEQDDGVKAAELEEVLNDYATSGAAIVAGVVIGLIKRTNPSQDVRLRMKESAQLGKENQIRRRFFPDANAYDQVIQHLDWYPNSP